MNEPTSERRSPALPKPSLWDHVRVFGLLIRSLVEGVPYLLVLPICVPLRLWLRSRTRKKLRSRDRTTSLDEPPTIDELATSPTVFVVVGEASGDTLAAPLVADILRRVPLARIRGYGGPKCEAAGMCVDRDITSHAVMGTWSVIATLGVWWRICVEFLAILRTDTPDLLLTVDFPGLNGRFAQWGKKAGVRTVHMVAPQVWAHAPWRAGRWRRAVDLMLSVFPFEPTLHRAGGMRSVYVGHPLFEAPLSSPRTGETRPTPGAAEIELWPGSRNRELQHHARMTFDAAKALREQYDGLQFSIRLAKSDHKRYYESLDGFAAAADGDAWIRFAKGDEPHTRPLLGALACSGTATAELAVALVPTVVFYRISWLQQLAAWGYLNAPWFSLPNVIAGRELLPEHLVVRSSGGAELAASFIDKIAPEDRWREVRRELTSIRNELETHNVTPRAAGWVCAELNSTIGAGSELVS